MSNVGNRRQRVLVVEDSPVERRRYLAIIESLDLVAIGASSISDALSLLGRELFDFVLTDIHLSHSEAQGSAYSSGTGGGDGLALILHVHKELPSMCIIAMTSDPNVVVFERAMANGAHHFIKKPVASADEFAIAIDTALERKRARKALAVEGVLPDVRKICPEGMVISGEHLRLVELAARSGDIPLIIYGETGTGKEEVAKLLHRKRKDRDGSLPLVIVNCANLGEELLESALFGHRKGAFSGAVDTTTGFVAEADGGILFLDEIHTLSIKCQQKLLRVLNDGTYQRVGETRMLTAHFQVVAATTKDLDEEVDAGRFVLDLRTRISGIEVRLPPLRERMHDLPTLIRLFFARGRVVISEQELLRIAKRCETFYWRGNVRQLFMALNVLVTLAHDSPDGLRAENLPIFKTMLPPEGEQVNALSIRSSLPPAAAVPASPPLRHYFCALTEDFPLNEALDAFEKDIICGAIERHERNLTRVCNGLRLGRSSLDLKRKRHKIGETSL